MESHTETIRALEARLKQLIEIRDSRREALAHDQDKAMGQPTLTDAEVSARSDSHYDDSKAMQVLLQRDEQIYSELMKLQRTLSRQTFRGAESARRLVRRLARKAGQNVEDARANLKAQGHPSAVFEQPPVVGERDAMRPVLRTEASDRRTISHSLHNLR